MSDQTLGQQIFDAAVADLRRKATAVNPRIPKETPCAVCGLTYAAHWTWNFACPGSLTRRFVAPANDDAG